MSDGVVHELKTVAPWFEDVLKGRKTFEVRRNDRNFREGDELMLREYSPSDGYTGRWCRRSIGYILADFSGLHEGFIVMGLKP